MFLIFTGAHPRRFSGLIAGVGDERRQERPVGGDALDHLPGRSGEHRESVSAGLGIHADVEWARMRDDGPGG